VTFQQGDIFLIRTGYTDAIGAETQAEQEANMSMDGLVGVEGSAEVAKWFWNKHFAAVAGDTPSFEAIPHFATAFQDLHASLRK
jgi:kynurenine formamidase